jgi:hypothetical protein
LFHSPAVPAVFFSSLVFVFSVCFSVHKYLRHLIFLQTLL